MGITKVSTRQPDISGYFWDFGLSEMLHFVNGMEAFLNLMHSKCAWINTLLMSGNCRTEQGKN